VAFVLGLGQDAAADRDHGVAGEHVRGASAAASAFSRAMRAA
jgi:hypothetical protein